MKYTGSCKFKKPEKKEKYNVDVFNQNMEIIDDLIGQSKQDIENIKNNKNLTDLEISNLKQSLQKLENTIQSKISSIQSKINNISFKAVNNILQFNDGTGWKDMGIFPNKPKRAVWADKISTEEKLIFDVKGKGKINRIALYVNADNKYSQCKIEVDGNILTLDNQTYTNVFYLSGISYASNVHGGVGHTFLGDIYYNEYFKVYANLTKEMVGVSGQALVDYVAV